LNLNRRAFVTKQIELMLIDNAARGGDIDKKGKTPAAMGIHREL
jgi:hypothetical protein